MCCQKSSGRIGKQSRLERWELGRCNWVFMRVLSSFGIMFQGKPGLKWQALAMRLGSSMALGSPITRSSRPYPRDLRGVNRPKACLETEMRAGMATGCRNHGNFPANRVIFAKCKNEHIECSEPRTSYPDDKMTTAGVVVTLSLSRPRIRYIAGGKLHGTV